MSEPKTGSLALSSIFPHSSAPSHSLWECPGLCVSVCVVCAGAHVCACLHVCAHCMSKSEGKLDVGSQVLSTLFLLHVTGCLVGLKRVR